MINIWTLLLLTNQAVIWEACRKCISFTKVSKFSSLLLLCNAFHVYLDHCIWEQNLTHLPLPQSLILSDQTILQDYRWSNPNHPFKHDFRIKLIHHFLQWWRKKAYKRHPNLSLALVTFTNPENQECLQQGLGVCLASWTLSQPGWFCRNLAKKVRPT